MLPINTLVEDGEGKASGKNYLCLRTVLAREQMYINWPRINSAWKLEDCFWQLESNQTLEEAPHGTGWDKALPAFRGWPDPTNQECHAIPALLHFFSYSFSLMLMPALTVPLPPPCCWCIPQFMALLPPECRLLWLEESHVPLGLGYLVLFLMIS